MRLKLIFETNRLLIRSLQLQDRDPFYKMMSNPNVMNPIPLDIMDRKTSDNNFEKHLNSKSDSNIKVWALELKEGSTFIGIAAYLKNNQKEDEIAYRLIENFWGVGMEQK